MTEKELMDGIKIFVEQIKTKGRHPYFIPDYPGCDYMILLRWQYDSLEQQVKALSINKIKPPTNVELWTELDEFDF